MEPGSDADILVRIREAERAADRIVRDAETDATARLARAEADAAALVEECRERLSRQRREALDRAIADIDREARACLADAMHRVEQWTRTRKGAVDRIVDRLLALLLPS